MNGCCKAENTYNKSDYEIFEIAFVSHLQKRVKICEIIIFFSLRFVEFFIFPSRLLRLQFKNSNVYDIKKFMTLFAQVKF